jgi:hypothetical protein
MTLAAPRHSSIKALCGRVSGQEPEGEASRRTFLKQNLSDYGPLLLQTCEIKLEVSASTTKWKRDDQGVSHPGQTPWVTVSTIDACAL